MAFLDVNPLNQNIRRKLKELFRLLRTPASAFSDPKIHVKTLVRDTLQKTMLQGEAIRSAPGEAPPEVKGAGNTPYFQPWLHIDPKQQALLGSKEAQYGRFTSRAGPTPASFSTYAGTGLTLERIASVHREVDTNGYMVRKSDMDLQILRRDAHLQAVDRSRREAVFQSPFRIKPFDHTEVAAFVCNFVRAVFDDIDGFDSSAGELMIANACGFSSQEIVYKPKRIAVIRGNTRTLVEAEAIASLEPIFNRHWRFHITNDEGFLDMGAGGFVNPFKNPQTGEPTYKILLHRAFGDGYLRQRGYMFAAHYLHLIKHQSIARWGTVLETYGVPTPYLQMDDGDGFSSDQDKQDCEAALRDHGLGIPQVIKKKWGELKHAPIPAGVDARGMHAAIWGAINTELSKLVAGATLQFELGAVGSYGAADTHADQGESTQRIDARLSAETYRTLIRYVVEKNVDGLADASGFSPEEICGVIPKCYWVVDRKADPVARMNIFVMAKEKLGLEPDPEQIAEEFDLRWACSASSYSEQI